MEGQPAPEVCVGAVVFDEAGRLLLIERGRGAAIGRWSVPGGRVEPGETLEAAVEREVAEETGLAVRCGRFVGWVQRIGPGHHFVILDFMAELISESTAVAGDDAADVAWVGPGQLEDYALVEGLAPFLQEQGLI